MKNMEILKRSKDIGLLQQEIDERNSRLNRLYDNIGENQDEFVRLKGEINLLTERKFKIASSLELMDGKANLFVPSFKESIERYLSYRYKDTFIIIKKPSNYSPKVFKYIKEKELYGVFREIDDYSFTDLDWVIKHYIDVCYPREKYSICCKVNENVIVINE